MINLAAAAVLVRDLTEQHLDGAGAPAGRNRRAQPAGRPAAVGATGRRVTPAVARLNGGRSRLPRSA
jgi:hypothetical protein